MPKYPKPIRRLLKRSAKFRKRLRKALTKHDENVDLAIVNSALEMVDREIVKLGQMKVGKKA